MRVHIRLFGLLRLRFPTHSTGEIITVDLPDDANVKDLLDHLELAPLEAGIVVVDGTPQREDSKLSEGAEVFIIQGVSGG